MNVQEYQRMQAYARIANQVDFIEGVTPEGVVLVRLGLICTVYFRNGGQRNMGYDAALKSASRGKFQVMEANYGACGEPSVTTFFKKMCRNEVGQIELLAGFIKQNAALWKAVKEKDWHLIAYNYNGPNYKSDTDYDVKMNEAYEHYCKNAV